MVQDKTGMKESPKLQKRAIHGVSLSHTLPHIPGRDTLCWSERLKLPGDRFYHTRASLSWWVAAPITSRIKEEIGPTLWKSKQHLSTVMTILCSSLRLRTRVSLSYTSKAKAHCQVTGIWLGAPCSFPMGTFIFRCPTLEGGSSQPAAETVGLWNTSSPISLLAVINYFKSRIMWSLVNVWPWTRVSLIKLRTTASFRFTLSSLENNRKRSLSVCHHFPALHL